MYRSLIQIFNADGEYIRDFGAENATKVIDGPGTMFLDQKRRLFVANVNAANVLVFDLETEELLQTVGLYGDMFAPNAVTVDDNGYIYVVDTGGQRVIVYNPEGSRPVRIINGSEDGRGQSVLANPRGIAVRGDWIYVVSNLTHTIYAFDKEGKEVFAFGKQGEGNNEFMHPNGMSIDSRGRMLITDTIGARVAVYR
jgi:DNA-binding beta-propeller fold protein YncE